MRVLELGGPVSCEAPGCRLAAGGGCRSCWRRLQSRAASVETRAVPWTRAVRGTRSSAPRGVQRVSPSPLPSAEASGACRVGPASPPAEHASPAPSGAAASCRCAAGPIGASPARTMVTALTLAFGCGRPCGEGAGEASQEICCGCASATARRSRSHSSSRSSSRRCRFRSPWPRLPTPLVVSARRGLLRARSSTTVCPSAAPRRSSRSSRCRQTGTGSDSSAAQTMSTTPSTRASNGAS